MIRQSKRQPPSSRRKSTLHMSICPSCINEDFCRSRRLDMVAMEPPPPGSKEISPRVALTPETRSPQAFQIPVSSRCSLRLPTSSPLDTTRRRRPFTLNSQGTSFTATSRCRNLFLMNLFRPNHMADMHIDTSTANIIPIVFKKSPY